MRIFSLTVVCLLSVSAQSAQADCLLEEELDTCHSKTNTNMLDELQREFVLEDLDAVIDAATVEVDSGRREAVTQPKLPETTFVAETVDQF